VGAIKHPNENNYNFTTTSFYSAPQCSHCKRCTSYGNSVRLSVCHTPVLCQNDCTVCTAR